MAARRGASPRAVALVAVVACGAPASSSTPRPPVGAPVAATAVAVAPLPSRLVVHAPPASGIDQLAITADGTAVVSADGGRLWPALDGSVEPVVLDLPVARAAAIARAGSGFHVAVVDEAGGVVVETLDRDGGRIGRVSLGPEPPATTLVATAVGAVVARADQTLALVDWDGAVAARLAGATGAVTAARCGWRFGRTARPHPVNPRGVSVCADLARR